MAHSQITTTDRESANARMDRERQFWHEHSQEYLEAYPEQFVAVKDGQVFMTDVELGSLLDRIEEAGLKPWDTWVRFFSNEPLIL